MYMNVYIYIYVYVYIYIYTYLGTTTTSLNSRCPDCQRPFRALTGLLARQVLRFYAVLDDVRASHLWAPSRPEQVPSGDLRRDSSLSTIINHQ